MVQGKKINDMSNGTPKSNMSFQRKDGIDARSGNNSRNELRQNGNAGSFRTDTSISGARNQGERVLQKWQPDAPTEMDGSLESMRTKPSGGGGAWDQFAENERRFGLKTDYNEDIYTTKIDKSHPLYKQRVAEADRKAREIERSTTSNSHVAEERILDNVGGDDKGGDEEDKYSGVRRQQDFPPLTSSHNKYTPPARRAPTGQATVSGAPVDPAIISSQLARPEKSTAETNKVIPVAKATKVEATIPSTALDPVPSTTLEPKVAVPSASASRTASPQAKPEGAANATATVERDVSRAFKTFAVQQRRDVEQSRLTRIRNDKEVKLNDLKKFADTFKLFTPVPSDLVSIIAKDPAKQKEIQEKAKRNAEESKANPDAAKPIVLPELKSTQRPAPTTHLSTPSNPPTRQHNGRNTAFANPSQYNRGQSQAPPQSIPNQQSRVAQLGQNIRARETNSSKISQPSQAHEARLPPTGPANSVDPNFSRRSSGVASMQGGKLNPHSSEFRPSPHAATFSPHGNPSSGSSPRSAVNAPAPAPITRSLLRRKPSSPAERAKVANMFDALGHIKTLKPGPEKKWDSNGGMKPAYDTHPAWRQVVGDEKPDSTMQLTYSKLFEMAPFPTQPIASPLPTHVLPQPPHQHQLPFHLQQGGHNMQPGRSPRAPPMNLHGNQHHGPVASFNGHDEHRMMPSLSAQSYGSPRMPSSNMSYASPMNQSAQLVYNPQMMPYGGITMQQFPRSHSQSHQYIPQGTPMGPIMMQTPANGFLNSQGMAGGPQQLMYPQAQHPFMPPVNGHPPPMQPNGFPSSPGRTAPMMMSQGSQQGHQQPMYGMNPGMSPGPQYNAAPMYAQQPPGPMQMRGGYGGPNQYGTSPQQMHQFGPQQHRNNHQNGTYNNSNNKNFPPQNQHPSGPNNNQIPTGPQARASESNEESK